MLLFALIYIACLLELCVATTWNLTIYVFGKITGTSKPTSATKGSSASGSASSKSVIKEALKVPKARDLPPATKKEAAVTVANKLPASAPVQIVIYLYTNAARIFVPRFPAEDLFMILVRHRAKPGLLWQFNASMNACLQRVAAGENPDNLPHSWETLQADWNIKTSWKPRTDPDGLDFANDITTFYLSGNVAHLENFLALLDTFFGDRVRHPDAGEIFPQPITVYIYPHTTVHLSDNLATRMDFPTNIHRQASLPIIPFSIGAPAYGNQHVIVNFDFTGEENQLDITLTGNLYPFRAMLEAANVRGQYYGPENPQGRQTLYCRILNTVDMAEESEVNGLIQILTTVMSNQLMIAKIEGTAMEDTPARAVLEQLQAIPSLFWTMRD